MVRDTLGRSTGNQLKQAFDPLRELVTPPDPPKRPIGFVNPEGKGSKKASGEEARLRESIVPGSMRTARIAVKSSACAKGQVKDQQPTCHRSNRPPPR
jgi:hypothetical protein